MHKKLKLKLSDILKPIEPYLARVDKEILDKLSTGIPVLDESAMHLFSGGGKKIRASLIILSSGIKGPPPDDIASIAAAAEIVHCASLIHDDIIDESEMRRGLQTVSKKWGNSVAVLVGDYMYTSALGVAVDENIRDIFPILVGATSDMVKGELYQIEYSGVGKITKEHYFKIIELKTARFMAACMKLGAVKGEMFPEEADMLYNAGLNLGFAFQIVDDTLDMAEHPEQTGKDIGNDFYEGKITLPLLHLIENSTGNEREELFAYLENPDHVGLNDIKSRIRQSGTLDYCLSMADQYNQKALDNLSRLPSTEYRDVIIELSKFLVERNY